MRPAINELATYELCFGNAINVNSLNGYNIKTSGFTVNGIAGTVYMSDIPDADRSKGRLILFKLIASNQVAVVRNNIGEIDYKKGEINIFSYHNYIYFYFWRSRDRPGKLYS